MTKPCHHLRYRGFYVPRRKRRATDQDHGKSAGPCGMQLGHRSRAARVLGHNMADAMFAKEGKVALNRERATGKDDLCVRQRQFAGRIDKSQEVVVLGPDCEIPDILLADGQKDACGRIGQGGDGSSDIGDRMPDIAGLLLPFRALKGKKRQTHPPGGLDGIARHLGGKGMRCVDDMRDAVCPQPVAKPRHPAKAANAGWQGLGHGRGGASGIGKHRVDPGLCKGAGQRGRLGRAAKQQNADGRDWHG